MARLGDGWIASAWHSTPGEFSAARLILEESLREADKEPEGFPNAVDTMFMYLDDDGNRARRLAAPVVEQTTRGALDLDSGHFLVGDFSEAGAILEQWINAGAKEICVWPLLDPVAQIKQMGDKLLPDFF